MKVLITGTTSGLGKSLARYFSKTYEVYSINKQDDDKYKNIKCELSRVYLIKDILKESLSKEDKFDCVILNAGVLGMLARTEDINVDWYYDIFNINVLSNKVILDYLIQENKVTSQVIAISSGAYENAYYGWSLYCASKSAFKQIIGVYAQENENVHFLSLAPGVMATKMQDFICAQNEEEIPSVKKFKQLRTDGMLEDPDKVAKKIYKNVNFFKTLPSGSFADLRKLKIPNQV